MIKRVLGYLKKHAENAAQGGGCCRTTQYINALEDDSDLAAACCSQHDETKTDETS